MSTIVRGNAAEAAVLKALVGAGIQALVPFGGGFPFDLGAATDAGELVRLQVKSGRVVNGCVEFNCHSTDHGRGQLDYRGRADLIAVYVETLDRVFVVPVDDCPSSKGYLRLAAARNNQRRRVRYADDYAFESWAASFSRSPGAEPGAAEAAAGPAAPVAPAAPCARARPPGRSGGP
jgi:hypothetical protein